jgi:hypothetical protein
MIVIDEHWHAAAPPIDIRVPGFQPIENAKAGSAIAIQPLLSDEFRIYEPSAVSTSEVNR